MFRKLQRPRGGSAPVCASEGAQVVIFEIDESRAAETLDSLHGTHSSRIVDVSDALQVESAIRDILSTYGHIDALVNVAGGSGRKWGNGPTDACTLAGWEKTLTLNLNSVFYM